MAVRREVESPASKLGTTPSVVATLAWSRDTQGQQGGERDDGAATGHGIGDAARDPRGGEDREASAQCQGRNHHGRYSTNVSRIPRKFEHGVTTAERPLPLAACTS